MSAAASNILDLHSFGKDTQGHNKATQPICRNGPLPLEMHVYYAMSLWLGVIPFWPSLMMPVETFFENIPDTQSQKYQSVRANIFRHLAKPAPNLLYLQLEIAKQAFQRLEVFFHAIRTYQSAHLLIQKLPYQQLAHAQWGSATIRDYGGEKDAIPVLIIPSLINNADHLDLLPETSFISYLKSHGYRPFLLDWGIPGMAENRAGFYHYCYEKIIPVLQHLKQQFGLPVVIGHCMGGTLAMAALSRRPDLVSAFLSLAAPWDFSEMPRLPLLNFSAICPSPNSFIPKAVHSKFLQAAFSAADPFATPLKYYRFGTLIRQYQAAHICPDTQPAYREFIALEDWINSDRPLSQQLAWECLQHWFCQNNTHHNRWKIQGYQVKPYQFYKPSLIVAPHYDSVVPPKSARDLDNFLPNSQISEPAYGHVNILTSTKASQELWPEWLDWMKKNQSDP